MDNDYRRPQEDARVVQTRELVLTAARKLLLDEGQDAVTPTRLAEVTGISRSTIYRHWTDPSDIIFEATATRVEELPFTRTGDPRRDLRLYLEEFRRVLGLPQATLLATQMDRAEHNTDVEDTLRLIADRRRDLIGGLVQQTPDDFASAHALLIGPLVFQRFMARREITDDLISRVVDAYLTTG